MSAHAFPETMGYRKFRLTQSRQSARGAAEVRRRTGGKGWLMLRSLLTLPVTILLLASASNAATAARVCIGGHFHYGGSGLHHDRGPHASKCRAGLASYPGREPASNQIHCKHAPRNEVWRCFVRDGPCRIV